MNATALILVDLQAAAFGGFGIPALRESGRAEAGHLAMTMTPDAIARERDAFLERMLQSARGTFDLFGIYIGVRLGFYEALAAGGPQTSGDLAARTGTAERYVREWLEQQTVAGPQGRR